MKLIHPSVQQATSIVQAMQAVLTAEGRFPLLPIEVESMAAIQRHLLHQAESIEVAGQTVPEDLADIIVDAEMRHETIRILALLPVLDQQVRAEKVSVVEAIAQRLGVEDRGLVILREAVRRRHKRIAFSIMSRAVAHYWSPTGKARLRDYLDMVRIALPPIPGIYAVLTDKRLLAKYQGMATMPASSLGYALFDFYRKRDFPLPGEPKSFPEGWSKHEVYHVLSEYDTSLQGEMLVAAFSGGNTEKLCMDLLLATLLQFHAGRPVLPGPVPSGMLQPDAFFRAIARGAAMNVDLLKGWDIWSVVDRPVAELRSSFQIPTLTAQERQVLAENDALIA